MKKTAIFSLLLSVCALPLLAQEPASLTSKPDQTGVMGGSDEYLSPTNRRPPTQAAVVDDPEVLPEFIGGDEALAKFIAENMQYPEEAAKKNKQGTVIVSFIVDNHGNVCAVRVTEGVNELLDAEAERIIKAMPKWRPGRDKGRLVSAQMTQPITFQLKKKK